MKPRPRAIACVLALATSVLSVPISALSQTTAAPATSLVTTAANANPPATPVAINSPGKEVVNNPYGLGALWAQGDFVARGTLIVLVIMSMGSWYILITKLYESFKIGSESRQARLGFFKAASLSEAVKTLKEGSAFRFIAETGIDAS